MSAVDRYQVRHRLALIAVSVLAVSDVHCR
ncbi:Ms4533A family Cys-rich leader peptide [Tomitella biformata]